MAADFPQYLWDLLLPQAELTLNLLRQANVNPKISAWEYFQGAAFQYDATPLGPFGCPVMIHKKTSTQHSWDFQGKEGWSVGVVLEHYRCDRVVAKDTKAEAISDTVEYRHQSITSPTVTPANRILHGIYTLTNALTNAPSAVHDAQLDAITVLRDACQSWAGHSKPTPQQHVRHPSPPHTPIPMPHKPTPTPPRRSPRVHTAPSPPIPPQPAVS